MFQMLHWKNSNFTLTGDAICDGGYLQWEYQEKYHGLTEVEVPNLSTDDLERSELKVFQPCQHFWIHHLISLHECLHQLHVTF